jgi:hypothetical protein
MALDDTRYGTLNINCPDSRERHLRAHVDEVYGSNTENNRGFLAVKFSDAGNLTPVEMARGSCAGLNTALCLLRPVSGC